MKNSKSVGNFKVYFARALARNIPAINARLGSGDNKMGEVYLLNHHPL